MDLTHERTVRASVNGEEKLQLWLLESPTPTETDSPQQGREGELCSLEVSNSVDFLGFSKNVRQCYARTYKIFLVQELSACSKNKGEVK